MDLSKYRWRKTTDIDREYSIFELLVNEVVVLNVGFSDENSFEIAFHHAIANSVIAWDVFEEIVGDGRRQAEYDRNLLP